MSTAESAAALAPDGIRTAAAPTKSRMRGDLLLYVVIAALVGGAWLFTQQGYFEAGDDVGYWIGVVGGVLMLLLFSYPLRKYFKVFHRWGKVKWWFLVHMFLGIGGPLLILVHSTFRVASINAAVALYSMLIVAGSGVIGRFLYVRINSGLRGEAQTLRQVQARLGLDQTEARSKLAFAPAVEARLLAFESRELADGRSAVTHARQAFFLTWQGWLVYQQCCTDLGVEFARLAPKKSWTPEERASRTRAARRLVQRYVNGVVRVAQFGAYERLFALWHVAHVPFVYLLVISAVVHVFAVHAY